MANHCDTIKLEKGMYQEEPLWQQPCQYHV